MKVIALSALVAVTSAIQYRGFGYTTAVPHTQIGSRWGLKPTKTWIAGPGGESNTNPRDGFAEAIERQRVQEESFAVDSIHQNGDFAQVHSMDVPTDEVGSQWGLKPTQTWIPGPGGESNTVPRDGFSEAEARQKKAFLGRSVDSVHQNIDAQIKSSQTTDDLVEQIIDSGMTPVQYHD